MSKAAAVKMDTISDILATVLHDLNPLKSVEDWKTHIETTKDNPEKFFNGNGVGLEEYYAFTRTYDRDTYEKNQKIRR